MMKGTKTVLFYSHRGGTGRSLCLANCAVEMAKQGKKVIAIDMDMEAGGLDIIFKENTNFRLKDQKKPAGLTRLILSKDIEPLDDEIEHLKQIVPYSSIGLEGDLDLLPLYMSPFLLDAIDQYRNQPGEFQRLVKALKDRIVFNYSYDYIFIDLPTGINYIRETFLAFCEAIVMLSRPNRQGAFGTRIHMDEFKFYGKETIFALSCVPDPDQYASQQKIDAFKKNAGLIDIDCIIPFDDELAFSEDIPLITRRDSDIGKAYRIIVEKILKRA